MDDATRFRALFEATFSVVRRYVHRRGVTGGRTDDVVAETFVVAWQRLKDVPDDDPIPWLFAVARNVRLNQLRGDRRYRAMVQRLPQPVPAPPPTDASDVLAVRQALAALAPSDREILCLVAWEGLSAAQIGVVLGCSAGAARVRLHRARQRLAEELVKRSGDDGQRGHENRITCEASEVTDDRV